MVAGFLRLKNRSERQHKFRPRPKNRCLAQQRRWGMVFRNVSLRKKRVLNNLFTVQLELLIFDLQCSGVEAETMLERSARFRSFGG